MVRRAKKHPRLPVFTAAALVLGLLPAIAGAAVLIYEPFDYPDGNLVGNGGWLNHSGVRAFIQVVDGKAVLMQGAGGREDANRPLPQVRGPNDVTYVSFQVTVTAAPTFPQPDYFAHLMSPYRAKIFLVPPVAGGDFTFGICADLGMVPWRSDFSFGSTHQIVTCYDQGRFMAIMWVDPTSQFSPFVVDTGAAFIGEQIGAYALRQGGLTTSQQLIDDIVVGESFDDVIDLPTATVPSSWGRIKAAYR